MHWNDWSLGNELPIRLSFFLGIFAVMAGWEILSPRRLPQNPYKSMSLDDFLDILTIRHPQESL